MSAERVLVRVLDGEFLIGESDRLMSRKQALAAASATVTPPGTVMILDGSSYRPIVVGDVAGLAASTTPELLAVNYYRLPIRTGTKRTAFVYQDCRVNGKKLMGLDAFSAGQKTTLFAKMKTQNIQVGF